jgi:uncharacterized membrane protein YedE/YeeE
MSYSSPSLAPAPPCQLARPGAQHLVVAAAALALALLAIYLGVAVGWRQAALAVVGAGLGLALYHAAFGFTAAYRRLILSGRGAGLRAQLVMLALAALAFAPLLSVGEAFGRPLGGAFAPLSISLLLGAFVFGLGMQLASGCASGTLYTVGGGSTRMVLVLAAFILGSYGGTWHFAWWQEQPKLAAVSLYGGLGWAGGLALQLAIFAALYGAALLVERRRHGAVEPMATADLVPRALLARLAQGPWPLLWGGVALALLNLATLLIAGRPWGVTWAFALWGGKLARLAGDEPVRHAFWQWPAPRAALERGLEYDVTSVMNAGIVLGALLAAGLAGRFAPTLRIGGRSALAAVIGGLMLGYGARLGYGCNIGAFFSGVASGSVHGWVWLIAALAGTLIGVRLRPLFGLANETAAAKR